MQRFDRVKIKEKSRSEEFQDGFSEFISNLNLLGIRRLQMFTCCLA